MAQTIRCTAMHPLRPLVLFPLIVPNGLCSISDGMYMALSINNEHTSYSFQFICGCWQSWLLKRELYWL